MVTGAFLRTAALPAAAALPDTSPAGSSPVQPTGVPIAKVTRPLAEIEPAGGQVSRVDCVSTHDALLLISEPSCRSIATFWGSTERLTFVNARSPMCRQTARQNGRSIGSKMMFWQQRTLGRLAAHMLVVWVFSLTAGIVNACVVGAESRHAVLSEAQGPSASAATDAHDGAVGATDGDHPPPCGPTDPCTRFCADESTRLPTLKQPSAPWTGIWLAPPPSPLAVTAPQDLGQRTARPDALLRRERIPIPIAFLRLTL